MRLATIAFVVLTCCSSAQACFFPFWPGCAGYGWGWPAPMAYGPSYAPMPAYAPAPACNSCGYGSYGYGAGYAPAYGYGVGGCSSCTSGCSTCAPYSAGYGSFNGCNSCGGVGCSNCGSSDCAPGVIQTQPTPETNSESSSEGTPNREYEEPRAPGDSFGGSSGSGGGLGGSGIGGGAGAGSDLGGGTSDWNPADRGGRDSGGRGGRDSGGMFDTDNDTPGEFESRFKPGVTDPQDEGGETEAESAEAEESAAEEDASTGEMLAPDREGEQARASLQLVSRQQRRTNPFETRNLQRGVRQTTTAARPVRAQLSDNLRPERPVRWMSVPVPGRARL